jgi:hypothetical protein
VKPAIGVEKGIWKMERIKRFRQWIKYLRPRYKQWYVTGPLWLTDAWYNSKEPRYEIPQSDE